jgi:5-methylcytosine-specific restriction endonuclease McrA
MYTDRRTGNRYTQPMINKRLRDSKREFVDDFMLNNDYLYCERCKSTLRPLDISHDISVGKCKNESEIELIWDKSNFELLCRDCHKRKDGLDLKFRS